MDIRFEINGEKYQLVSSVYDFTLRKHSGYKKDETGKDIVTYSFVGYFKNPFQALEYLIDFVPKITKEVDSWEELGKLYYNLIQEIRNLKDFIWDEVKKYND